MPRPKNILKPDSTKNKQSLSGFSPEVQEKANKIADAFLEAALEVLESKIKNGAVKKLTLPELMKEIRGILKSIQTPPHLMMAFNLPGAPQTPVPNPADAVRDAQIVKAVRDPAKLAKLRESQQRHLENKSGPPTE